MIVENKKGGVMSITLHINQGMKESFSRIVHVYVMLS